MDAQNRRAEKLREDAEKRKMALKAKKDAKKQGKLVLKAPVSRKMSPDVAKVLTSPAVPQVPSRPNQELPIEEKQWNDYSFFVPPDADFDKDADVTQQVLRIDDKEYFTSFLNTSKEEREQYKLHYLTYLKGPTKDHLTKGVCRSIPMVIEQKIVPYFFTHDILFLLSQFIVTESDELQRNRKELLIRRILKWDTELGNPSLSRIIPLSELKEHLDLLKIDRDLITIVPDIVYQQTSFQVQHGTSPFIYTFDPEGRMVLSSRSALFYIFRSVICGLIWNSELCKEKEDIVKDFKNSFFEVMRRYAAYGETCFVKKDTVENEIEILKNHKFFTENLFFRDNMYECSNVRGPNDKIPFAHYEIMCKKYDLDTFIEDQGEMLDKYLVSLVLIAGWIRNFFFDTGNYETILVFELVEYYGLHWKDSKKELVQTLLKCCSTGQRLFALPTTTSVASTNKNGRKVEKQWKDHSLMMPIFDCFDGSFNPKDNTLRVDGEEFITRFSPEGHRRYSIAYKNESSKRTIIRSIPVVIGKEKIPHILYWEMIDAINIVYKKQGFPWPAYGAEVLNSRKENNSVHDLIKSIPVNSFKRHADSMNIDRDLIVIVPDIIHRQTTWEMYGELAPCAFTYDTDGQQIFSVRQGLFYIFHSIVCGVNWNSKSTKNLELIEEFKKEFIVNAKRFIDAHPSQFIRKEVLDVTIENIKYENIFKQKLVVQDRSFEKIPQNGKIEDRISKSSYEKVFKRYGLDVVYIDKDEKQIPLWMAIQGYIVSWIKSFCSGHENIQKILLEELITFRSPPWLTDNEEIVQDLLNWCREKPKANGFEEAPTAAPATTKQNNVTSSKPCENSESSSDSSRANSAQRTTILDVVLYEMARQSNVEKTKNGIQNPQEQKRPEQRPTSSESKLCEKCTRNVKKRSEAQVAMEAAVKKADKYEEKALKAMDIEKNNKKLRKEMEELKKEMERIKNDLEKSTEKEEKLIEANRKLNVRNSEFELQVKTEKQKTIEEQQEKASLARKIDAIQLKFVLKDSQKEEETKKLMDTIRVLQNNQRSTPGPSNNSPCSSKDSGPSTSTTQKERLTTRGHLMKWWKLKDEFEQDLVLKGQKEMAEKLLSITEDEQTKRIAEYESRRMEKLCTIYLETIEFNILKLKNTDDAHELLDLPSYPTLSQNFIKKFQEEMKKQPEPNESGCCPLTNCYICFDPYVDGDKKDYCNQCKKPVHVKCNAKWRETLGTMTISEWTCGLCRQKMDDKDKSKTKTKK